MIGPWTEAEAREWAPPEVISRGDWIERYRVVSARFGNPEPGPWRWARAPFLLAIFLALTDPRIRRLVLMKGAQVGGSDGVIRNAIAYWIANDPGPTLIVFPTEKGPTGAEKQMEQRVLPMIEDSPELRKRLVKASALEIHTDAMSIVGAFYGSPSALASNPYQRVIFEEADKAGAFAGKEADPFELGEVRTRTYGHRKKLVHNSTPTTPLGAVSKAFEMCQDRRRFFIPCDGCGDLQPLSVKTLEDFLAVIKWTTLPGDSDEQTAARLSAGQGRVWYECPNCHTHLDDDTRLGLISRGQWVSEGFPPGEHPDSPDVGFHLTGLMATIGVTWRDFAVKYLRVKGNIAKLMGFVTQELGLPFTDTVTEVDQSVLRRKAARGPKRGTVPRWAGLTLIGADTQKDSIHWQVWAYGAGERACVIDCGVAPTFKELEDVERARYHVDGSKETMSPRAVFIDMGGTSTDGGGSRSDEVYRWCAQAKGRRFPVKGYASPTGARPQEPISDKRHEYRPKGAPNKPGVFVRLFTLDTIYLKDILAARVKKEPGPNEAPGDALEVCQDLPDSWFTEMESEQKVTERRGQGFVERWVKKDEHGRNESWDIACYLVAAGRAFRTETMPTEKTLQEERDRRSVPAPPKEQPREHEEAPWTGTSGSWWTGRRE